MLLALAISAAAQKDIPDYKYDPVGNIAFFKVTESGVLLLAGSGGLAGVNPGADKAHFVFAEYGKVKEEEVEYVPKSPYVIISQGGKSQIPGTIFANSKKTVIDVISGQKLFATEDKGWKQVAQVKVFLPQNKLVVVGNRAKAEDERLAVGVYDLATGEREGYAVIDRFTGRTRSAAAIPMSSGAPFLLDNRVVVPTTKGLIAANINSGEIEWENKDVDKISWITADATGTEIYGFEERSNGDTRIHKVSSTGQLLWAKERKVKGQVSRFEIISQGLAIVADDMRAQSSAIMNRMVDGKRESQIAFLNAATGEDLWDKVPKTKGFVQHFYIMDDGVLFGIYSGGINKISFDGNTLFKKPLSTGENIQVMAHTPQGLIYITESDANIVDLKTGDQVWKKPLKYSKAKTVSSAYDPAGKRYLISTGKEILAVDENDGEVSSFAKISLGEKEEPNAIDVRQSGILLTSSQNLLSLNPNGDKVFHTYHKSPGQSGFMKVAMGAVTAASAVITASSAVAAGANRNNSLSGYNSYGANAKRGQDAFEAITSASFQEMTKRFRASSATENAQFILTNLDGGVGLVKVNKDTGETEKEIVLKDKKPEYEVDDWGGYLYYKSKNNEISAFKL